MIQGKAKNEQMPHQRRHTHTHTYTQKSVYTKMCSLSLGEVRTKARQHDAPWSGSTPKGKEADSTLMASIWEPGTVTHCRLEGETVQSLRKTAWPFVKAKHNIAI